MKLLKAELINLFHEDEDYIMESETIYKYGFLNGLKSTKTELKFKEKTSTESPPTKS